jgi:DNA helicase II / ATP-dependent DNA helicase PcrA
MSEASSFPPPAPMATSVPGAPPIGRYLAGLNPVQRQAVEVQDGPVLVLAGAGTGKTRVLTTRLAYLLASGAAKPWTILSVTFTNKAAREMRERVAAIMGPMAEQIWLGTFHALCARLLRRHAELIGLQSNFTILDADDQVRLLKQLLQAEQIDDKKWPARLLMGVIQRWKDRGLTPDKVARSDSGDLAGGKLREIYAQYQDRLLVLNAADFGDLLLHCLTLFQEHPDVLKIYQDRFSHILVDEYQDTNVAQYLWLRLLAQGRRNICCVGDDDQSIYGWRGAEVGNILKFEQDFPGAQVIRLEQNYRSTSRVLAAASGLISHNEGRLGKTLWTEGDEGDQLILRGVWDGEEEARVVGEQIETRQRAGTPLRQMAILVRAGFQTREFEERFLTLGVPYQVVGGARFYERMEIRDAIAYLRVINQPDDDLALERIINKPKRGIGAASLQAVHHLARGEQISFWAAISKIIETDELRPAARKSLTKVLEDFQRWRSLVETEDHSDLAGMVLDESGYTGMLQADRSPEAPGRLENLKELVSALEEFESLGDFLEHISLVMENAETNNGDQVSVMTLHAAKGLEFDVVFLPGWEEGVFPNQRSLDENGATGLEEERRLAYVGITRARKSVEISHAANRRLYGTWQSAIPSRFIGELPEEHVEIITESGLYGGGGSSAYGTDNLWDEPEVLPPGGGFRGGANRYGPGYRRRGGVSSAKAPTVDGDGYLVDRSGVSSFSPGDRVFHQKFGMGTVSVADGDKLDIAFDKAGDKKVIASFVSRP